MPVSKSKSKIVQLRDDRPEVGRGDDQGDVTLLPEGTALAQAYIVTGEPATSLVQLKKELVLIFSLDIVRSQNPDWQEASYEQLGIAESRLLAQKAARRPFGPLGNFFILTLGGATLEAQNALLKTLEEPASQNRFFLLVHDQSFLLPTILSRCQLRSAALPTQKNKPGAMWAEEFIAATPVGRQRVIQEVLAAEEKKGGERVVLDFCTTLVELLRPLWLKNKTPETTLALTETISAVGRVGLRGGSDRLLLEHLAGIVPARKAVL